MRNKALSYRRENKHRVKSLRKTASVSEVLFLKCVEKQRLGFKFRFQHPVGPYVLDFYCAEARLCIEIDGPLHAERRPADLARDEFLVENHVLVIRIPSEDLWEAGTALRRWLERIMALCEERSGRKAFPE